ncbi:hypothetical protein P43SY_010152 [Pythium insidiosum]|uniref:Ankyrin repeat domain-containing protein n=1 Tax=Pythium insidiosum TaxID=114742 RepID=A0AAD5LZI0_PYTIN|nr:hypothetical protein P43SY_010152 [Pythium insidiosum]
MELVIPQVLGDAVLFREITSFQAGLPFRVASYLRQHSALLARAGRWSSGALPRLAVLRDDAETLAALWALTRETVYYREMPVLSFAGIDADVAAHGRPACLAWLHGALPRGCRAGLMAAAALAGNAAVVEWLARHCPRCASNVDADTVGAVAARGFAAVLRALHALSPDAFDARLLVESARHGHLAALQFLHGQFHSDSQSQSQNECQRAMHAAAAAGQLNAVQYLHSACGARSAANGHLAVVEFLHAHRSEGCTAYAMDRAAANGHLDVLSFLQRHRREGCSPWALADAAENGHLAVVQFLHAHALGQDWDDSALYRAARRGHLDVVTYLCEATTVTDRIFDARRGAESFAHHDVVRFLNQRILLLLEQRELEQRARLRRRRGAKAKKKRK